MMSDPAILFVKPQSINADDKDALKVAGVIVVEIDDPSSARLVRACADISSSALLRAAVDAIRAHSSMTESVRSLFGNAVCAAIISEGNKRTASPNRVAADQQSVRAVS